MRSVAAARGCESLYEYFAPVRAEVAASGMTEAEVNALIDQTIRDVRHERD